MGAARTAFQRCRHLSLAVDGVDISFGKKLVGIVGDARSDVAAWLPPQAHAATLGSTIAIAQCLGSSQGPCPPTEIPI